jgi:DNA polymerase-3 subunit beta
VKFRCERDVLAEAVGSAARAATNQTGTMPVLAGIRMEVSGDQLTIVGTDLELTIRLSVDVGGERDGATVVRGKLLGDIVKSLPPGAVEIDVDENMAIRAGRSDFSVRPFSLEDYPVQGQSAIEPVVVPAPAMSEALSQVVRAASTDDARAALTGVLLASEEDGIRMVATDSYRLAVRDLPDSSVLGSGQKVLIPAKALTELQRLIGDASELSVGLGEREATFDIGSTRLSTRLIEAPFPNYRNLLPTSQPNVLTVGKAALSEAIRRVKILAQVAQDSTPIRLELGGDTVRLSAITQDIGDAAEEVDASYEGAEMTVAFNPDYLAAGIDAVDSDDVTLTTMDPMKPAVLRGVGRDDYLYLLMPVRVA